MGIQINGQTDIISATDGSLTISGADLPTVTNLNATGIVTATGGFVVGSGTSISSPATNTLTLGTNGTTRLTVQSTGEVKINGENAGVGQTALSIQGNYASNGNVDIQTWARTGGAVKTAMRYVDTDTLLKFGTTTNHGFGILINGTEKVRVTNSANSGTVIMSDTGNTYSSLSSFSTYAFLQVVGSQAGIGVRDSTSGVYRSIYTNSSGNLYFYNGTNEGYLSSAGAWTNASDERLKQNIRPIGYGLTTALSLVPRHYEMIDNNETHIGFIAQEVEEIIPEVVSTGDGATGYKGLDYGSLVAVAFKAIQEQQNIISELQARLDAAGL